MLLLPVPALLAFAASAEAQPPRCDSAQQVLATAQVTPLPADPDASGITLEAEGLRVIEVVRVSWPTCSVRLQSRVWGPYAVTDGDIPVTPSQDRLITRNASLPPADAEPGHPDIAGARFISSTSLATGRLRAGLWKQGDGRYLMASYRPGQTAAPDSIMRSASPILGLFYLGAPDAFGGTFSFWQSRSDGSYRFVGVAWTEKGLR